MYNYKKHFSLHEAQGYLPRLRFDVGQMILLKKNLDEIGFNVFTRKYRPGFNPDTLNEFPDDFVQLLDIIQALSDDGIVVKGIEEGLVDFPAVRKNGEEVFLCWKEGETDITHWHSLDGGFRARRPMEEF
jgi:hypothetical protein